MRVATLLSQNTRRRKPVSGSSARAVNQTGLHPHAPDPRRWCPTMPLLGDTGGSVSKSHSPIGAVAVHRRSDRNAARRLTQPRQHHHPARDVRPRRGHGWEPCRGHAVRQHGAKTAANAETTPRYCHECVAVARQAPAVRFADNNQFCPVICGKKMKTAADERFDERRFTCHDYTDRRLFRVQVIRNAALLTA